MTSGEYSEAAIWVRQVQSRGSDQCVWPWIVTWTQDAWGYCHGHYQRLLRHGAVSEEPLRKPGRLCSVQDCPRPHKAKGYCATHYKRVLATGDPHSERPIRETTGEGSLSHGYLNVPVPREPGAMADFTPKGQRVEDVVAFSIEMLARFAPEIGSWAMSKTTAS